MSNPFQDARELQRKSLQEQLRKFPSYRDDEYLITPKAIMYGIILGCAAWGVVMLGLFLICR